MKIAFSGIKGAYAETAAKITFPGEEIIPYSSFSRAYKAVSDGKCDYGILPIENSYAGDVSQVLDLLYFGNLNIVKVVEMPIKHCLLGINDADINNIKKVYSHPQALEQCKNYIENAGYEIEAMSNTAMAAKAVAMGIDATIAAIAGKETAKLYGLSVLDSDIGDSPDNTTRFATICPRSKYLRATKCLFGGLGTSDTQDSKSTTQEFSLVFTVKDEAGALAKAVTAIGKRGFNMKSIQSRPSKKISWSYYFYVECEGDIEKENGKLLLQDLKECCENIRVIGNYECVTVDK